MTIVLDTNLLLLFVVGVASPDCISMHKRLQHVYTNEEFVLLTNMLSRAIKIIVTPNTLTETSNLIKFIAPPARIRIYERFRLLIGSPEVEEQMVESKIAVHRTEFVRLGLADCALLHILTETGTLLTTDLDLYLAALSRGLSAQNLNHFRNL